MTMQIFRVFLKVFVCILNLNFCFYLNDLDIGDFIDNAIYNITKHKLLTIHFEPDHN